MAGLDQRAEGAALQQCDEVHPFTLKRSLLALRSCGWTNRLSVQRWEGSGSVARWAQQSRMLHEGFSLESCSRESGDVLGRIAVRRGGYCPF